MLALAHALEGLDRGEAARLAGMDRQTLRDWVIRFNESGVEGLGDRPESGRRSWLDEGQLASLRALVLRGPDPERDGVGTWRAKDLCRIVEQPYGVTPPVADLRRHSRCLLRSLERPSRRDRTHPLPLFPRLVMGSA
jgi:transposase